MDLLKDGNIIENKVIKSFLAVPENKKLYDHMIMSNDENSFKELNKRFKEFFLEIRLLRYISTIIHNSVIELDIRTRKKEQNVDPYDEVIHDKHSTSMYIAPDEFSKIFEHEKISASFKFLTEKEKKVITLAYLEELKEVEIAKCLNITQQAVSKTKRRALQKIRKSIGKGDE
ncbi:sigma-70 family RNA polymerase sigma factor [uncultured Brevibacillus sp.]|uniref:sigma-70 family RNA polymerase sigma factor n=1 Tax=uncultured Brevibacillus sp. TaxID=169970 RepID=UPI002595B16B|nr:sigma-70 family RNA polymerase sigma factor [uncultured Brevibacillus sp.]